MTKKEITEQEYNEAIKTLEFIKNEKNMLKNLYQTKQYQCHISLPETLEELLLTIKKQNETLDLKINQLKKEFISNLNIDLQKNKINDIKNLLDELNNNIQTKNNNIQNSIPNFLNFYKQITELISIKETNLFLENYIQELITEESQALKIKKTYENKQKRDLSHKKKILKKF